ncbi:unnamed protein product [Toxocara canis]|uniref:DUF104 domain-containing protein n=1 Tax=Toxocara canis TaxID=6265 RepID=A0A183UCR6_TOXCA|nr:unnamed protein product [Toxocara canis]
MVDDLGASCGPPQGCTSTSILRTCAQIPATKAKLTEEPTAGNISMSLSVAEVFNCVLDDGSVAVVLRLEDIIPDDEYAAVESELTGCVEPRTEVDKLMETAGSNEHRFKPLLG